MNENELETERMTWMTVEDSIKTGVEPLNTEIANVTFSSKQPVKTTPTASSQAVNSHAGTSSDDDV